MAEQLSGIDTSGEGDRARMRSTANFLADPMWAVEKMRSLCSFADCIMKMIFILCTSMMLRVNMCRAISLYFVEWQVDYRHLLCQGAFLLIYRSVLIDRVMHRSGK